MSFRFDGYTRIRAKLDLSDKFLTSITDVNGDAAVFPRGAKLRFELGLFYADEIVDASQIALPRLRVLSTNDPDSALGMDSNSATVRVKGDLTLEQWLGNDPANAHIVIEFPAAQTAEGVFTGTLADGDSEHWFLLTDGLGADFIAAGIIKSRDGGYNPAAGTPPATGAGADIASIEALINAKLANVVHFTGNPAGATIELLSPNGLYKVKKGADNNGDELTETQVPS